MKQEYINIFGNVGKTKETRPNFGRLCISKNRCIFMLGFPDLFYCLMKVSLCASHGRKWGRDNNIRHNEQEVR